MTTLQEKIKQANIEAKEIGFVKDNISHGQLGLMVASYDKDAKKLVDFNLHFYKDEKLSLATDGVSIIGYYKPDEVQDKKGKVKRFVHNPMYPIPTSKYGNAFNVQILKMTEALNYEEMPKYLAVKLFIKHADQFIKEYSHHQEDAKGDLKRWMNRENNKEKKIEEENINMNTKLQAITKYILTNKKGMVLAHKMRRCANLDLGYRNEMSIFMKIDWMLWKQAKAGTVNIELVEQFLKDEYKIELNLIELLRATFKVKNLSKKDKYLKNEKLKEPSAKDEAAVSLVDNVKNPELLKVPEIKEPKAQVPMSISFDIENLKINYTNNNQSGSIPLKLKASDKRGKELELFKIVDRMSKGKPYPKGTIIYVPAITFAEVVKNRDFKIRAVAAGYTIKLETA